MIAERHPRQFGRALIAAALANAIACSGPGASQPDPEPPPPASAEQACGAGDVASCLAIKRASCRTGDRMWSMQYEGFFPLRVATAGMIRVDYLDSVLLGVNSSDWLACMDACPGTDATDVCIPFRMPVAFNLDYEPACQVTDGDAEPWQGQAARRLDVACDGDRTASVTYVPERARIRDALIAVDAIGADSRLARLNGLVVRMTAADNDLFRVQRIADAECADFDVPGGYQVLGGADRFDQLQLLHPKLDARLKAATAALREDLGAQLLAEIIEESAPELRARCRDAGLPVDTAEDLAACYDGQPDIRSWLSAVFAERFEQLQRAMAPQLDAVMRAEYVEPLCRHFAGQP